MIVEDFIRSRQGRWKRLESLLDTAENSPEWELGAGRLQELVRLYRQVCADLSEARSYTANAQLLGRLNDLAGRGYRFVYRRSHTRRLLEAVRRLFVEEIPASFRRETAAVLVATVAFALGAVVGAGAVLVDRENGEKLIPGAFFTTSPKERVREIEKGKERISSVGEAAAFGASLYTHNIQVAFLSFALGALTLVGGFVLLFENGAILGAVAGMYWLDGVETFFVAWVGPHGALELPSIVFATAAGLRLGRALWLPGAASEKASLRAALPSVARMLAATIAILVLAGLIEGSFSQFSAKTFPYALKTGVAGALFALLVGWLFLSGRRAEA